MKKSELKTNMTVEDCKGTQFRVVVATGWVKPKRHSRVGGYMSSRTPYVADGHPVKTYGTFDGASNGALVVRESDLAVQSDVFVIGEVMTHTQLRPAGTLAAYKKAIADDYAKRLSADQEKVNQVVAMWGDDAQCLLRNACISVDLTEWLTDIDRAVLDAYIVAGRCAGKVL